MLDFAAAAKASNQRLLLPMIVYSDVSYQRGANISKWFLRFRRSAGVPAPNTPFHSFRNTFVTIAKGIGKGRDTLVNQIVGHKTPGVPDIYTGSIDLEEKVEIVERMTFGINLAPIKASIREGSASSKAYAS